MPGTSLEGLSHYSLLKRGLLLSVPAFLPCPLKWTGQQRLLLVLVVTCWPLGAACSFYFLFLPACPHAWPPHPSSHGAL